MNKIATLQGPKAKLKMYELNEFVMGYKYAIVSVKPYGIDNLSASVFVWLTNHDDIQKPEKEIYFDCGDDEYSHSECLSHALRLLPQEHINQ